MAGSSRGSALCAEANGACLSDRRHRLLLLVGELGCGGSEGQLSLILEHFDLTRWEVRVAVFHPSPVPGHGARLREHGIQVAEMGGARGRIGKLRFTMQEASRFRPSLVHSWTVHDNPYAALAGMRCGARASWGSLRGSLTLPGFSGLPSFWRWLALRSVKRIVVNSRFLSHELNAHGLGPDRVLVLPNCVRRADGRAQASKRLALEKLGFQTGDLVVGNVGNIRRVKNQAMFVRALSRVVQAVPAARGLIVGATLPGEETARADVDREISRLGLEGKVVMAGFRPDVAAILPELAALGLSSDSEGMPNVVLEAMAAGTPVVATAVGGVPELVRHGETGLLAPPGDAEALADLLVRVLAGGAAVEAMRERALQLTLSEHSPAATARRLEGMYAQAIGLHLPRERAPDDADA